MKILVATDAWHPQVNGVVRSLEQTAEAAAKLGATFEFLSPDGTGYPQRGLPASNLAEGYHRYRVLKPLPANEGVIGPAFGEPGGGLQYRLTESVQWYIDHDYLEEITP